MVHTGVVIDPKNMVFCSHLSTFPDTPATYSTLPSEVSSGPPTQEASSSGRQSPSILISALSPAILVLPDVITVLQQLEILLHSPQNSTFQLRKICSIFDRRHRIVTSIRASIENKSPTPGLRSVSDVARGRTTPSRGSGESFRNTDIQGHSNFSDRVPASVKAENNATLDP